jgi:short-subunit dehydrogenase
MSGIAAVTGASRGIGRATTRELARAGYKVFAVARSDVDLQQLADEASRGALQIIPVVADVADDVSRGRAVTAIFDATQGYGLDVVVNNAGYGQMGPIEEVSPQQLRSQLEVNVIAPLAFTQPFLPGMRERRSGRIVNVSSNSAHVIAPFSGAYAASKTALDALSDALRLELYPFGVDVVLVEPGPIPTKFREVSLQLWPHSEDSPYAPYVARLEARKQGWYLFQDSPESVARVILRAVQAGKPRVRYTITLPAKLAVAAGRLVPDRLMDWFLRRSIGLDRR